MITSLEWAEFKSFIDNFSVPFNYISQSDMYDIWYTYNNRVFQCLIEKKSPASPDQLNFENDYKSNGNIRYNNSMPSGTSTYFTSAGDDQGIGDGETLFFKLTEQDTSKSKTLSFNEDLYIKEGKFSCFTPP